GHHLVYFPIQARPSELHPDGTDADHWPGRPFMRRMWAGGEVRFRPGWEKDMPLDGREAVCTETVEEVRLSGEGDKAKAFVDVWRRYTVADGKGGDAAPAIEERRTLVFMPEVEALTSDAAAAAAKSPPRIIKSPHTPDYAFALTPNRALLANFSALTYNAHSIHLDAALTLAEGHRALLVHGPLTLALAFAALRGAAPREGVRRLEYRNVRPLYCGDRLRVCVREKEAGSRTGAADERRWDVWVEGPAGGMAVKGTAFNGDALEVLEYRHDWAAFHFTLSLFKFVLFQFAPEVIMHSRSQDEEQVRDHYDRGDDFYGWFLGPRMIYTSGIISDIHREETLEEMQDNKLAIVCEKIGLQPGDTLLDMGCGWGTLARFASEFYGAKATGVTLGRNQTAWGNNAMRKAGIPEEQSKIVCCDYRDTPTIPGGYKKITCLEMGEHRRARLSKTAASGLRFFFESRHAPRTLSRSPMAFFVSADLSSLASRSWFANTSSA
ncbi:hypothetical protein BN1723_017783, partial [Verticillium longisporum]